MLKRRCLLMLFIFLLCTAPMLGCDDTWLAEDKDETPTTALASDEAPDADCDLTPDDCLDGEVFDAEECLCLEELDCEGEDCEEELSTLLFGLADELLTDLLPDTEDWEEDGETLVTYQVDGNRLTDPETAADLSDEMQQLAGDMAQHALIWENFRRMIPEEQRALVSEFVIFTDGPEENTAAVEQLDEDATLWVLAVDIADASDPTDLTYTLVHEFGHLLSLNENQVPPNLEVFADPENEELYAEAQEACETIFTGEGCAAPDSYMTAFYEQFWKGKRFKQWDALEQEAEDDEEYETLLEEYYARYEDEFVTDYAATAPWEDLAESWAHFVLYPKPKGRSIADQKVRFFYDYPELVSLRREMMERTLGNLRRRSR